MKLVYHFSFGLSAWKSCASLFSNTLWGLLGFVPIGANLRENYTKYKHFRKYFIVKNFAEKQKNHDKSFFNVKQLCSTFFAEKRIVMNLQNNFTKSEKELQGVLEKWNKKILPNLPKNLDELAKKTGVVQRKRGIRSASDLLKILFLYACSNFSFRILACAACALGISGISDTAWRKHFSAAATLLREILHDILSSFLSPKTDTSVLAETKNVLLVDASIVSQEGCRQEQQRIHLCYSLN